MFLDSPLFTNIIFYPRKHKIPLNMDNNIRVLKFQINPEILIGGFIYIKDIKLPTILLFHGNGEIALDYQYFAPIFHKLCNVNLAVVDFRGYGFSSGAPYFSSLYEDALPVYNQFINWINDNEFNKSIFVLGRSLGSYCAAEIGSNNPNYLKGIIFESGVGNTFEIMTQLFQINTPELSIEATKNWSNDTRASKFKKPTLIIHGNSDWIVPHKHGKILFDALPNTIDKKLVIINGAGHNDIFQFQNQYFKSLKEFINKNK
ncbi:MAG: alpha/beta hydrolase [Candidatus Helarchaeota archaeon]